jgi:hypothetical protein
VTGDDVKGLRIREISTVHPNTKIIKATVFTAAYRTPL